MTRYYTSHYVSKYGRALIGDLVNWIFVLRWDPKRKVHVFLSLVSIDRAEYDRKVYGYDNVLTGTEEVIFEKPEHEKEFLDFHPDASNMRVVYRYGSLYPSNPCAYSVEDLPIEKRRGRWCWKKA